MVFPIVSLANSSWCWISETRPYDILPWVAILTIAIETISINIIPEVHKLPKTFCFVALANLLSFATPYLLNLILFNDEGFGFEKYLDHWPSYTVGIIYGIMTVVIELPVVYNALKKNAVSKKKLIFVIICVNIVTTLLVAITERIFCQGQW